MLNRILKPRVLAGLVAVGLTAIPLTAMGLPAPASQDWLSPLKPELNACVAKAPLAESACREGLKPLDWLQLDVTSKWSGPAGGLTNFLPKSESGQMKN